MTTGAKTASRHAPGCASECSEWCDCRGLPTPCTDRLVPSGWVQYYREDRNWWRAEADRRLRDMERALVGLGVFAAVLGVVVFWLGA